MKLISVFVARNFPWLGSTKRLFTAFIDTRLKKNSYSQFGEDKYVYSILKSKSLLKGVYIDVGSNHPTSISNTYLFYKNGYKGYAIEPNRELSKLHRIFRSKDKVIQVGIGDTASIEEFNISKTPGISSFKYKDIKMNYYSELIPILKLDSLVKHLKEEVFFLSIDTEGFNINVLRGSLELLKKVKVICIEFDNLEEKKEIESFLTKQYNFLFLKETKCNLIYINNEYL